MSAMGSHDVHSERPRVWYVCDSCGSEYSSPLARDACEDDDRANRFDQ